ncbi:MAG TPA: hypothetical protein VLG16_02640 [Candidatus Saccharimonadales bacterium]|nr:hypothetical protein [Candidatus Saccharimonadales bacterium]
MSDYATTGDCLIDKPTPEERERMLSAERALLNAIFSDQDTPTDFTDLLPDFPQTPHDEA